MSTIRAHANNLRYNRRHLCLRCDLRGGIAPAALAAGADGGDSQPVSLPAVRPTTVALDLVEVAAWVQVVAVGGSGLCWIS